MIDEIKRQELRSKNAKELQELENKYSIFESFEIFSPIMPEYFSYAAQQRKKLFEELQQKFNTNNISIKFNKSDICIRELNKIYNDCINVDLRIHKYLNTI